MKDTFILQQQAAIKRNQSKVCALLDWTPTDYSFNMYQSGLCYLNAFFSNDKGAVNILDGRKEFWNWWKIYWNKRDEAFIENLEYDPLPISRRLELYCTIHNPAVLACEIAPNRVVFGKNFTRLKTAI